MTDQLFKDESEEPQATPEQEQTPSVNPNDLFSDQLAVIKNEQGVPKYKTVEDAIVALQHSQQYIPELKDKLNSQEQLIKDLQEKLEAGNRVKDLINQGQPQSQDEATQTAKSLNEQDIEALLEAKLAKLSQDSKLKDNQSMVNKTLTDKFGAEASAMINKKAAELGMKPSQLGELAKENPAMVLALFGEKKVDTSPTLGSVRYPLNTPTAPALKRPEVSVLSGATSKTQAEFMRQVRDEVYKKHGITG